MEHLILRLDAPLQSWGTVAMDPRRPTSPCPTLSALTGLIASALGWRYRDAERTNALQDSVRYAVREDVPPVLVRDYQTADLGRIGSKGWTRWGVEKRGGGPASTGTQILEKHYLAGGVFTVALALEAGGPVQTSEVADALDRPARPLFFGRKGCIPASRILQGTEDGRTPFEVLSRWPVDEDVDLPLRCWHADGQGPDSGEPAKVTDRRNFTLDRFAGRRTVRLAHIEPPRRSPSSPRTA